MTDRPRDDLTGPDKQQDKLVDRRGGTRDEAGVPNPDDRTPEGLRREPKGPYGPTTGRA
jgi:hypothetical protein